MKTQPLSITLATIIVIVTVGCTQQSSYRSDPQLSDQTGLNEHEIVNETRQTKRKKALTKKQTTEIPGLAENLGVAHKTEEVAASPAYQFRSNADSVASRLPQPQVRVVTEPTDRENYLKISEGKVKLARAEPVSTFSVDVDTAAYSNIRRMLLQEGRLPPRDAVRIEELVNYFQYDYPDAKSVEVPFSVSTEVAPAPWNPGKHLLQIGLEGYQPESDQRPDANLVFLIDVSGSMQDKNKLPLVKRSLKLLVNKMEQRDRIALVVYAGGAGTVLESTPGNRKREINRAIDGLHAGGSTNGSAGIRLAYDIASENFVDGGINRVIIASDGDMNVGTVSMEALKDLIKQNRESGVSLTTLGFGTGNYNYSLMEQMADVGNGNAAYIDGIREAQKVLVDEMQSTLLTIAKDVKIQVEFNPAQVKEYRLIGYENRLLNKEDFRNDKVDAGDIGAGHTVTALYELVLAGSDQGLVPEFRYSQNRNKSALEGTTGEKASELAYVRLRFKDPEENSGREIAAPVALGSIQSSLAEASQNLRFSAAVAGFGQILRGGRFTAQWGLDEAIQLAKGARGEDPYGYRSEFVSMAKLAKGYSPKPTNRKG
ncbi:MAG: VWA domain-containing protein [Acidiferrobacterales bacterium]|nr:VWA domain-containing protein [Acidiferrobacterales bacterium]